MARRAVVWGLGRFGGGLGAALELERRGFEVAVMDAAPPESLEESLRELKRRGGPGQRTLLPETPASLEGCDLLVLNPAIPPHHPLLQRWRDTHSPDAETSQEIDLLLERLPPSAPPRVLAITGTNGKSSTATLLHRALGALDAPSLLGGNIGTSLLLDTGPSSPLDQARNLVLELSSFQCARLSLARPPRLDGLILTPISRDHLGWHGDLEAYHQAKLRSLKALQRGTPMVFDPRCPVGRRARSLALELGLRPIPAFGDRLRLGTTGELLLDGRAFLPRGWPCRGRFQQANLGLVLALLLALDLDPLAARPELETFAGLPHRLQDCGSHQGVSLIDNGISTVAETSLSALRCLREELPPTARIHWVAGGKLKDKDLRAHLEDCLPLCASAHFFGRAAEAIGALPPNRPLARPASFQPSLRQALDQALATAQPGDLLLFSPAFSSHDQYPNFERRCQDALSWWREKRRKGRKEVGDPQNPTKGFLNQGDRRYHREEQAEQ